MNGAGEIRSEFLSTMGGVMTVEAGAIAGELELLTRPTPDSRSIEALVRYAGGRDLYNVAGSPLRAVSEHPDREEHRAAHDRILECLVIPGVSDGDNELPADLSD